MSEVILDTDIYSELLKAVNHRVVARGESYPREYRRFTLAAITVVEIVRGLRRRAWTDRSQSFIEQLRGTNVLPLDRVAAGLAGQITADLERVGRPVGWADPLIAAIALRHGLPLVTGNTIHFERIRALGYDLKLDNWREEKQPGSALVSP